MRALSELMDETIEKIESQIEKWIKHYYDHSKYDQVQEFPVEIDYKYYENKTLYDKLKKELLKTGYRIKSEETIINHYTTSGGITVSTISSQVVEVPEEKKLRITITTAPYVEKKKRKPVKPPKAITVDTEEVLEQPKEEPKEEQKEVEA